MIILHLRVTRERGDCEAVIEWVRTQTNRYLCCYEVATRGHSHIVFQYSLTESTFRQKLVKKFSYLKEGSRNEYYALSTKDDLEANERYVCKGNSKDEMPDIIGKSFQYTDELIEQRHKEYWKINDEIKKGDTVKQAREKTETFVQYIVKELTVARNDFSYSNIVDKKTVFECVMRCLGKKGKVLDTIIVRRLVYGVFNIIDPKGTAEAVYNQVFEPFDRVEW